MDDTQNQGLKKWPEGTMLPDTTNAVKGPSNIFLALDEFAHFRNSKGTPDTEASVEKEYFMGMDIGCGEDATVRAEGHLDENGTLIIDKFYYLEEDGWRESTVPRESANQGL